MWYRAAWDVLHSVRGESGGEWHRRHVFELVWGGKPREGNTWYCCIFTGGRRDWQIYLSGVHQHISLLSVTYSTPLLSVSPAAEFPYLQLLPGKETSLWYRIWNEVKLKHQSVNLRISDHSLLNARCTDFFIAHQLCRCKGLNLLWSIW